MEAREIASWLFFGLRLLITLGVLGFALAFVRRTFPRAGWMLGAAAGVELLGSCCMRAAWRGFTTALREGTSSYEELDGLRAGISVLGLAEATVIGALVIAALVVLAREAKARAAQAPAAK